eukprot:scaffold26263_cov96-Isochrysis_galbana.AAC.2
MACQILSPSQLCYIARLPSLTFVLHQSAASASSSSESHADSGSSSRPSPPPSASPSAGLCGCVPSPDLALLGSAAILARTSSRMESGNT